MATKKIKNSDIIEQGIFRPTIEEAKQLLAEIKKLEEGFKLVLQTTKEFTKSTKFTSAKDVKEFKRTVDETNKTLLAANKLAKERERLEVQIAAATQRDAVENEKLKLQLSEQKKQVKELAKEKLGLIGAYQRESKRLNDLRKRYKDLAISGKENTAEAKKLRDEIQRLDKRLKKVDATVGQHQRNVGNYTGAINEALVASGLFGGVLSRLAQIQGTVNALLKISKARINADTEAKIRNTQATEGLTVAQRAYNFAVGSGVKALRLFKIALASTGIGALLLAVGGLVSFFTRTQRGADKVASAMAGIRATIDVLIDRVSKFGEAVSLFFSGEFKAAAEAAKASFAGIGEEISNEVSVATELSEALHKLEEDLTNFTITQATYRTEIEKLRLAAKENNLETEARIELLEQARDLTKDLAEKEQQLILRQLQQKLQLEDIEAVRKRVNKVIEEGKFLTLDEIGLSESTREDLKEANDLIVKLIESENKALKEQRTIQSEILGNYRRMEKAKLKALETNAKNRIELIEDEAKKAIAVENQRFKKELAEAKKFNKEFGQNLIDLELIRKKHEKKIADIEEKARKKQEEEAKKVADLRKKSLEEAEKLAKQISELEAIQFDGAIENARLEVEKQYQLLFEAIRNGEEANKQAVIDAINNEFDLRKTAIENAAEFELQNEKLTAIEREKIRTKLAQDLQNIERERENAIRDANASILKEEKAVAQQRVELQQQIANEITKGIEDGINRRLELLGEQLDKEIEMRQRNIELQRELAAKGLDNTLAFEEAKLRDAELRKRELKQQEQNAELALAFIKAFNQALESEQPDKALVEALTSVGLAKAISNLIVGGAGFYEGTEELQEQDAILRTGEAKDNLLIKAHKGERIIGVEDSKKLKGMSNKELVDIVEQYRNSKGFERMVFTPDVFLDENLAVAKAVRPKDDLIIHLQGIKREIAQRPVQQVNVDELGNLLEIKYKNGIKEIIKHISNKRRI